MKLKLIIISAAFSVSASAQVTNDTIHEDSIDYTKYLQEVRVYGVTGKKNSLDILDKYKFNQDAQLQQNIPNGANILGIPFFLIEKLGLRSHKMTHKQKVKQILDNY